MLYVHSLETFGTQDGPGVRLVVFVQGCQMRCLYCHNPDTQDIWGSDELFGDFRRCPSNAQLGSTSSTILLGASRSPGKSSKNLTPKTVRLGQVMTTEEIIDRLERLRLYWLVEEGRIGGGLTVSGGEPSLQAEGLRELLIAAKEAGIHTAVDTNGGIGDEVSRAALDEADLLLLDIKQIREEKHQELTGQSNRVVLETAKWRESRGKPMWLRYVLVPEWTDREEDGEEWARELSELKMVERVEILPFHQMGEGKYEGLGREYKLKGWPVPSVEAKEKTRAIMAKYFGEERVILK